MGVQAVKEFRGRGLNPGWVQGARGGFLEEVIGWVS